MKIKSDKICVELQMSCYIDANKLMMYNLNDGTIKPYSEIDEKEIGDWIVQDTVQIVKDCDEIEHEEINLSAAE